MGRRERPPHPQSHDSAPEAPPRGGGTKNKVGGRGPGLSGKVDAPSKPGAWGLWVSPQVRNPRAGSPFQSWAVWPHITDHILLACPTLPHSGPAARKPRLHPLLHLRVSGQRDLRVASKPHQISAQPQNPECSFCGPGTLFSPSPRPGWALPQGSPSLPEEARQSHRTHCGCHRQSRLVWEGRPGGVWGAGDPNLTRQGGPGPLHARGQDKAKMPQPGPSQDPG